MCLHACCLALTGPGPWGHAFICLWVEAKVAFGRLTSAAQTVTQCVPGSTQGLLHCKVRTASPETIIFIFFSFLPRRGLFSFRLALSPVTKGLLLLCRWLVREVGEPMLQLGSVSGECPLCSGNVCFGKQGCSSPPCRARTAKIAGGHQEGSR